MFSLAEYTALEVGKIRRRMQREFGRGVLTLTQFQQLEQLAKELQLDIEGVTNDSAKSNDDSTTN